MTYVACRSGLKPDDPRAFVCWADQPDEIEAWFETRELADEYAETLNGWLSAKPVPGERARFARAEGLESVLDSLVWVEPSPGRILELQRERLELAGRLVG